MKTMRFLPFWAMMVSVILSESREVANVEGVDKEWSASVLVGLAQRSDPMAGFPRRVTDFPKLEHEMPNTEVCRRFDQCNNLQSSNQYNNWRCLNGKPDSAKVFCPEIYTRSGTKQADGFHEDTDNTNPTSSPVPAPVVPLPHANPSPVANNQAVATLGTARPNSGVDADAGTKSRGGPGAESLVEEGSADESSLLRKRESGASLGSKAVPNREESKLGEREAGSPSNPELPKTGSDSKKKKIRLNPGPEITIPILTESGKLTLSQKKPKRKQKHNSQSGPGPKPRHKRELFTVLYCKKLGAEWGCKKCNPKCPAPRT